MENKENNKWLVWGGLNYAVIICDTKEEAVQAAKELILKANADGFEDLFGEPKYGVSTSENTKLEVFGNLKYYYKTDKTQIEWM